MARLTKSIKYYNPLISLYLLFFFILKKISEYFTKNEPIIKKEKYQDKYLKEYEMLEMKEYSEKALKLLDRNVVEEETDKYGLIKMKYNPEENKFIYYTEFIKTIPYNILDVVARKYVVHFDCKCIFIDIKEELKNKEKENKEKSTEKKELEKSKKDLDDVFAKFKPYNVKEKANINIKNKINNYKYGGKIQEMELEVKNNNSVKVLSYKEFKKNV
tara:strand:+ start:244 stop:891 length:648 start_codon:yes stop_codon:yes gene_type:complete